MMVGTLGAALAGGLADWHSSSYVGESWDLSGFAGMVIGPACSGMEEWIARLGVELVKHGTLM